MTNAESAILSLIVEKPRHGYEMEQVIEERGMRQWTEVGFSSIYYLLKKLEKKAFISSQTVIVEGQGPARKVYSATPEGVAACRQATIQALGTPHRCYPPIQLGMANLYQVPAAEALEALKKHRDGLSRRLEHVRDRQASSPTMPRNVAFMFDHSLTMIEAERQWLNRFITHLEQELSEGAR